VLEYAECPTLGKLALYRAQDVAECGTRQSLLCRVPDKKHSAKPPALGKGANSGSDLCSFELLHLDCFFFSFFFVINSIVIEARDTNCVVVLVGTLCPV
jgi:hypothetical protein